MGCSWRDFDRFPGATILFTCVPSASTIGIGDVGGFYLSFCTSSKMPSRSEFFLVAPDFDARVQSTRLFTSTDLDATDDRLFALRAFVRKRSPSKRPEIDRARY